MKPCVTIALSVYNGASTLKLAVDSIIRQSFRNWELIILDDASIDSSLEVMHSFNDSRIRLVAGENNIGLSARLNMAADMANGSYFARMDQDDISYPDRIEKQHSYLESHQDVDLLGTATIVFRGAGNALGRLPVSSEHEQICARPWNGFRIPHPTWMGRVSWFRRNRYDSSADGAEDQHLLLRAYQTSRFACLEEPLLAYREGVRPLRRMLRTRRIFANSYIRQFAHEGRYNTAMKVALNSLLKVAADIMYLAFGITSMRSSLCPLSQEEKAAWQLMWRRTEGKAADIIEPDDKA